MSMLNSIKLFSGGGSFVLSLKLKTDSSKVARYLPSQFFHSLLLLSCEYGGILVLLLFDNVIFSNKRCQNLCSHIFMSLVIGMHSIELEDLVGAF